MEFLFMLRDVKSLYHSNLNLSPVDEIESIDLVTIAFNNPKVIELQNHYIKKHLVGNIHRIVVDNSSNTERSEQIKEICERDRIGYVRLHKNRMEIFGNYNHGTAVNWTYRHIVKPRGAWGFGFIDHDIFPVQDINIAQILKKQPIYGAQRKWNDLWYLSAIISFFKTSFVEDKQFDFMPITINGTYLDTGGGNWLTMYKNMNENELKFMSNYTVNFKEGNDRYEDKIELFDDEKWVHTINGSYWKKVDVVKKNIMEDLLHKYEAKNTK